MMTAPSAALRTGSAGGQMFRAGQMVPAPDRDGVVWVLFGPRPRLRCWRIVGRGAPDARILDLVRPLT